MNLTTHVPQISGIILYLSFYDWFLSLSIMSSRFIHVVARVRIFFLFKAKKIFHYISITFCLAIHQMDTWIVSAFCLLWLLFLWTWVSNQTLISIFMGVYLEVELLKHIVILSVSKTSSSKKPENNTCWQGFGKIWTLVHGTWGCQMVLLLWKTGFAPGGVFLLIFSNFLHGQSCHLWTKIVFLLLSQLTHLSFPFLFMLH